MIQDRFHESSQKASVCPRVGVPPQPEIFILGSAVQFGSSWPALKPSMRLKNSSIKFTGSCIMQASPFIINLAYPPGPAIVSVHAAKGIGVPPATRYIFWSGLVSRNFLEPCGKRVNSATRLNSDLSPSASPQK